MLSRPFCSAWTAPGTIDSSFSVASSKTLSDLHRRLSFCPSSVSASEWTGGVVAYVCDGQIMAEVRLRERQSTLGDSGSLAMRSPTRLLLPTPR